MEKINEVRIAYSDHTKAKKFLGFQDDTNLEETIREMFTCAPAQEEREVAYFNYEIEKNLYSFWKKQ